MILFLFWLCWAVYFCVYLGRVNFSSAKAQMIADGFLSKPQVGSVESFFFAFYAIGQLVNGFLGDKISAKKMIFMGLFGSGIANMSMGLFGNYYSMMFLAALNGYSLSMVWPPIIRVFSEMYETSTRLKATVNLASTMALGTLASYLVSAFLLSQFSWHSCFIAPSFIQICAAFIWYFSFSIVEKHYKEYGVLEEVEERVVVETKEKSKSSFIKLLFVSGVYVVVLPTIIHGVLKDGVTAWVPTYISETFATSPVISILATTLLPIINLTGAYAAHFMNTKVYKNEVKTSAFFFAVASFALVLLYLIGDFNIILTVSLLSIITSSMLAINMVLICFIPLYFGKYGRASTMSGFLNSSAYLGSAVSTVTIGILVTDYGWNFTILSFLAITLLAVICCILGRNIVSKSH